MKTKCKKIPNRSYLAQVFSGHVLKASLQYCQCSCDKLKKKVVKSEFKNFSTKKNNFNFGGKTFGFDKLMRLC